MYIDVDIYGYIDIYRYTLHMYSIYIYKFTIIIVTSRSSTPYTNKPKQEGE